MNALQKDLQDVLAKHIAASPHKLPQLIAALSDEEPRIAQPRHRLTFAAGRFTNLDGEGERTRGEHIAVYDQETGLMWPASPLHGGKELSNADALKAAEDCRLLDRTDWQAPDILDLLTIVDFDRQDPVVDPAHFKGPYGYTWTRRQVKGSASCSFVVGLYDGDVDRARLDLQYHALAVRAGQPLSFQF